MSRLPDKPSELIRLALKDLEAVEKNPQYRVDMGDWHRPTIVDENPVCSVCLAGAVMANTLGVDPFKDIGPWDFMDSRKLRALDLFRSGLVYEALAFMRSGRCSIPNYKPTFYSESPADFKSQLYQLADRLEEEGL